MSTPRSIRFEDSTLERLAIFAARRPGVTGTSAAARVVEEGLRMDAHPGVIFRDGPAGRRAVLIGGPDVHEVIGAVRATREAEPDISAEELLPLVSENTGVDLDRLHIAIDYYGEFADEIDALDRDAAAAEQALRAAMERTGGLLGV